MSSKRVVGGALESQKTLLRAVECSGIALHSGRLSRLRLAPAPADGGLVFVTGGAAPLPASHRFLKDSALSTTLCRGAESIATVEHVLSALHGLGIDNARLEIEGDEVPILDGSARPFVDLIRSAGVRDLGAPRRFLTLTRPVRVKHGEKEILALPANEFRATYAIEFPHTAIAAQSVALSIDERVYAEEIAGARTFCLLRDVEAMRRDGLARGGSLDNAVVVGEDGVLNGALRFPDEFVRHKVLDLVGDLALLGSPVRAHIIAFKGGHRLHAALVRRIMASRDSWVVRTSDALLPSAEIERFARLGEALLPRPAQPGA